MPVQAGYSSIGTVSNIHLSHSIFYLHFGLNLNADTNFSQSIRIEQDTIGYVIGGMLLLGFIFLILASVAAAFIPACPFKSSLTTLIKLLFESIVLFFRLIRGRYQPPWILNIIKYYRTPRKRYINRDINRVQHDGEAMKLRTTSESSHVQDHVTVHQSGQAAHRKHSALLLLIMILVVSIVVLVVLVLSVLKSNSGTYYALICLPFAASLSIFGNLPRSYERPPRYGLEYWIFLASVVIAPFMIAASYYSDSRRDKFMGLFFTGCGLQLLFTVFGALLFTFTPETRDTDAVAWLLVSTASQKPEHFRKAGQISNKPPNLEHKSEHPNASNYDHRKASLLTSLQPLLSSLITSKLQTLKDGTKNQAFPAEETLKDVEIYVACLAQLSNFENFHGSIWKNQSAVIHPVLSPQKEKSPLESALEEISTNPNGKFNSLLTSAARDALQHYKGGEKTEGRNQCISQVKIQDSDCDDLVCLSNRLSFPFISSFAYRRHPQGYAKIQDSDCDDLVCLSNRLSFPFISSFAYRRHPQGYALPYHTYNGHGRL